MFTFTTFFCFILIIANSIISYSLKSHTQNELIPNKLDYLHPLRKRFPPFPSGYPGVEGPIPLPYGPIYGCRGLANRMRDRQFDPYTTWEEPSFNCPYPPYSQAELEKYLLTKAKQREDIKKLPPTPTIPNPPREPLSPTPVDPKYSELERYLKARYLQSQGLDPSWLYHTSTSTGASEESSSSLPYYDTNGRYHGYVSQRPLSEENKSTMRLLWPYRLPWLRYPADANKNSGNENSNSNIEESSLIDPSSNPPYPSFDPYRLVKTANGGQNVMPTYEVINTGFEKNRPSGQIPSTSMDFSSPPPGSPPNPFKNGQ